MPIHYAPPQAQRLRGAALLNADLILVTGWTTHDYCSWEVCGKVRSSSSQPRITPFALPDPAVARHPNVLMAPRVLTQWLENLPLGNPPRSAQQALQQLRLLVRDPQPGGRLTTLLDCYTPTLDRLRQIIDARLPDEADGAMPLDQLELLVLEFVTEMACGYLRACNEKLVLGKAPPMSTLFRAATLLDDAAILASLHYYRSPQPHWQLLLDTYLLAAQLQLTTQPLNPKKPVGDGSDTIHGVFFRALLIACCDPHRHRPVQIRTWHAWLARHTAPLSLVVLPQGNAAIPVDISGKLVPLAAARNAKPGPDTRYVAADPLFAAFESDPDAPTDLRDTLTNLIRGRRTPEQRRAPRQPRNQPYQLLFGLHNITHRLVTLSEGDNVAAAPTLASRQLNQSKSGSAFQLPGPLQTELTVGDPLLAQAGGGGPDGAAVGFLARIQRIAVDPAQQVEIGVEKLPGQVMPVSVTGAGAERARGGAGALLLHTRETGHFTLIAPRGVFREGDLVSVEGPNVRHNLRMLALSGGSRRIAFIDVTVAQG